MKTCSGCKEFKPLTEFSNDKSRKDGRQRYCIACSRAHHKNVGRFYKMEWTYNLTKEAYLKLGGNQNGLCAICKDPNIKPNIKNHTTLNVDHDHSTNKIRGLLCHHCNTGLGSFGDDTQVMANAIQYLRTSRA